MTDHRNVPAQPGPLGGAAAVAPLPAGPRPDAVPPYGVVPPGASEATRLLCGGCYLDGEFRDAVIDELYVHEERLAAPALGYDAARVLAHALRARRLEVGWAAGILALWVLGAVLTEYLLLSVLLPCLLLSLAGWLRSRPQDGGGVVVTLDTGDAKGGSDGGKEPEEPKKRGGGVVVRPRGAGGAALLRLLGQLLMLAFVVAVVLVGFGKADGEAAMAQAALVFALLPGGKDWIEEAAVHVGAFEAWATLVLLLLVTVCVAGQRAHFAHTLTQVLHPRRFADMAGDPAESARNSRFQRLRARIRAEQCAPLVMYRSEHPFCGAGSPVDAWTLAVELRPDPDRERPPLPLSNRRILDRVHELLAGLRLPAPAAGTQVRDRLRGLEIDECVFLPVAGLPRRDLAPYGGEAFARHRTDAVEEGGETRRHFLRVRVGGWEEEVVITVFVRVHTQGGMLMLEIAPHVLGPVRREFEQADRLAHHYRSISLFSKLTWALARVPLSPVRALGTLHRAGTLAGRVAAAGNEAALPDGPAVSVRELGGGAGLSLFQEMDVRRYLKAVQDRVAHGVRQVLRDAGYRTDEFAQKVVNISGGGVHIEQMQGALAIGDHNTVDSSQTFGRPQNGTPVEPAPPPRPAQTSPPQTGGQE